MKKSIAVISALLILMSSCKLGQKYVKPELSVPESFGDFAGTDTFSIADMKWWEVFPDTVLHSLIAKAIENNKDLKIADERIAELAARKRVDKAALFPVVTGEAYGQRETLNYGGDAFKSDPEFGLKASISWEIDLWGNLRWANDRAGALLLESVNSKRALTVSLVAQVAQSYFELVALDNELRIVKQTLNARKESVRLAKLRFEGGLTSETSYQQAEVELARTATRVPVIERNIAVMENEIAFLIGEYTADVRRALSLSNPELPDTLPVGIPSMLLERRPDVRAAEQSLIAANAAVGVAYTNRFPRLTLTGRGGLESEELSDFLKSPMSFLGGSLLGPIFDMGRRQGTYRAQQAAYRQAEASYEKCVLTAFKEVRNAIVDYGKMNEIFTSIKRLESSAKTNLELAQLQYINGVISYLDVLDAQRSYFDARVSLSNAMRDKHLVIIRLYKSLGGGW